MSRSPRNAAARSAVSTGLSECISDARVAPRPASKARYTAPNCTPLSTKPEAAIRTKSRRETRSGPRSTRASTHASTAAITKRTATSISGAIARTPYGPAM